MCISSASPRLAWFPAHCSCGAFAETGSRNAMEWELTPDELELCRSSQGSAGAEHFDKEADAVGESLKLRRLWVERPGPSRVMFIRGDTEPTPFASGARFFLLSYSAGAKQAEASSWNDIFGQVVPVGSQWYGCVTRGTAGGNLTVLLDFGAVRTKKLFELQGNLCATLAVHGVQPVVACLGRVVDLSTEPAASGDLDRALWLWQERVRAAGDVVFGKPFVEADAAQVREEHHQNRKRSSSEGDGRIEAAQKW
jgi:hypothetical protein